MSPGVMSAMGFVPGGSTTFRPWPKNVMSGVSTRPLSTPPAIMMELMRGPMM